jgi:hypothetical protein
MLKYNFFCFKVHQIARKISKNFPGIAPRDPGNWGNGGRTVSGKNGEGREGMSRFGTKNLWSPWQPITILVSHVFEITTRLGTLS